VNKHKLCTEKETEEDMKSKDSLDPAIEKYVQEIITYYALHKRDMLPWRKTYSPYHVLVSEIMLQQTQVQRVIPKFLLWIKKYPTINALSRATLKDVLTLWQGLGYQRRAKALLLIAQSKNTVFNKRRLPTREELLLEPGIGAYTASAIMSFAYNIFDYPPLETNIRTAIIHFFFRNETMVTDKQLIEVLQKLALHSDVKSLGARDWYLALMDYGAYLKSQSISYNTRSKGYKKQTPYEGSLRKLRAETLFAIIHNKEIPKDKRVKEILSSLEKENFIIKRGRLYYPVDQVLSKE
jgi:A/G-specific adenine glycosylase